MTDSPMGKVENAPQWRSEYDDDPLLSNGYTLSQNVLATIVGANKGGTDLDKLLEELFPGDEDLGNTDSPELKVAWDKHPSFNEDPKDTGGGEGSTDSAEDKQNPPDMPDFHIGYEALGSQIDSMLEKSRGLVAKYQDLRSKVKATEGTVFGQTSVSDDDPGQQFDPYTGDSWYDTYEGRKSNPTPFAKQARDFAASMNPAQEKALQFIGGALEVLGEYLVLVNRSGQVYAAADRKSEFGPPPDHGVRG